MSDKTPVFDITQRSFDFATRIVKLCRYLEKKSDVSRTLISQLLDAGTSVGANLEEAEAGQSRRDFVHKNAIALKEARETRYWLRLIIATYEFEGAILGRFHHLIDEAGQISKIVAKIMINTQK
ncbi:MAG: four helix bundle protein [Acidobacteria bacterium]|nr:four helix bundle protein [Acidobacteriota bacterium]